MDAMAVDTIFVKGSLDQRKAGIRLDSGIVETRGLLSCSDDGMHCITNTPPRAHYLYLYPSNGPPPEVARSMLCYSDY